MNAGGIHWYDLDTQDGRAVCGYVPLPNDPSVTYAMGGATCKRCVEEIQAYLEELKDAPKRWPYAVPVAALDLDDVSGSC